MKEKCLHGFTLCLCAMSHTLGCFSCNIMLCFDTVVLRWWCDEEIKDIACASVLFLLIIPHTDFQYLLYFFMFILLNIKLLIIYMFHFYVIHIQSYTRSAAYDWMNDNYKLCIYVYTNRIVMSLSVAAYRCHVTTTTTIQTYFFNKFLVLFTRYDF